MALKGSRVQLSPGPMNPFNVKCQDIYMSDCPFCNPRIIKRQLMLETENEYVLYNIRKGKTRGRSFFVPKRHVSSLGELSVEEAGSLFETIWLVSNRLCEYLKPQGINYGFNEGEIAGQIVFHLHFHIMPRYEDDGMPEFHLFHGDPQTKSNFTEKELVPFVEEFKKVLAKK